MIATALAGSAPALAHSMTRHVTASLSHGGSSWGSGGAGHAPCEWALGPSLPSSQSLNKRLFVGCVALPGLWWAEHSGVRRVPRAVERAVPEARGGGRPRSSKPASAWQGSLAPYLLAPHAMLCPAVWLVSAWLRLKTWLGCPARGDGVTLSSGPLLPHGRRLPVTRMLGTVAGAVFLLQGRAWAWAVRAERCSEERGGAEGRLSMAGSGPTRRPSVHPACDPSGPGAGWFSRTSCPS